MAADSGDLVGVEALVRWQHPTRGLLLPAEFIALAESTTLIHRITTVVLDQSLAFARERLDQGHTLPVSVNVSTRCLLDPAFPTSVATQLGAAGVPGELLCLEITESTIMVDPDRALAVLRELHTMGVRLSVDDFGTGYSSMAYLKILPVDELKVDRTFVRDMAPRTPRWCRARWTSATTWGSLWSPRAWRTASRWSRSRRSVRTSCRATTPVDRWRRRCLPAGSRNAARRAATQLP